MKAVNNSAASFHCEEEVLPSVERFCEITRKHPVCLDPSQDLKEEVKSLLEQVGFRLYPTVEHTTLFYDPEAECFFKVLHPLTIKKKFLFRCTDRARHVYETSSYLISKGVKVPGVRAYGKFKKSGKPFFVMDRIRGKSLYDILVREKKTLPNSLYFKVMDDVAGLHRLGYWFGDSPVGHILIEGEEIAGFIDIDSIRRNRPFRTRNLAKDLAGLNHPDLPVTDEEKKALLDYYMNAMNIEEKDRLVETVKCYTAKRWH